MLYNPKWTKTADNCDVTLANFTAWVEAQNPLARYQYALKAKCAVGCWLKAIDHDMLLNSHWGPHTTLYQADYIAAQLPHSYGALAKRLRMLRERPF